MVMRPEFVAGFAVAEGSFASAGAPPRFAFTVALGARDGATCDALLDFFDVGHVYRYSRRASHHDDVAIYTVQSRRELLDVIVPFMDVYLPASRRRRQYECWRASIFGAAVPHSPAAVGSSVTSDSQSTFDASDQRRSRS